MYVIPGWHSFIEYILFLCRSSNLPQFVFWFFCRFPSVYDYFALQTCLSIFLGKGPVYILHYFSQREAWFLIGWDRCAWNRRNFTTTLQLPFWCSFISVDSLIQLDSLAKSGCVFNLDIFIGFMGSKTTFGPAVLFNSSWFKFKFVGKLCGYFNERLLSIFTELAGQSLISIFEGLQRFILILKLFCNRLIFFPK